MIRQNWYAVLGVKPDAGTPEIETAFAVKLSECSDHNQKVVLRHAREVLVDPIARTAYDTRLREEVCAKPRPAAVAEQEPGLAGGKIWFWGIAVVAAALAFWWGTRSVVHKQKPPVVQTRQQVVPQGAPTLASDGAHYSSAVSSSSGQSPESVYAQVAPSVVLIESIGAGGQVFSRGSGVAVGLQQVVTNCHVIAQAVQIRVRQGGADYTAVPSTSDTYLDLCMLSVPQFTAPAVQRASVKSLQVGQTVYAIGSPYGLERTLSHGLVSALRETPEGTLIQTSAAISPGSSGGGLFNAQGQLVGITTFQTKAGQNLNFAVPSDWLDTMRTR